jgi:amino acid transporter
MTEEKEVLKKEIGVRALALAVIGIVVGSGIYVIPALLADKLGATAILAYFTCGILVFLIALCFAEIGGKTNVSGGMYHYIEEAFGPFAGFLANIMYWFGGAVIADAAISNALVETLARFFPQLQAGIGRMLFLFLIFGGLAVLNSRSVKNSIRLVELASFIKLIPLFILIFMAVHVVETENLVWTVAPTFENIGAACLLLFFAFLGFEVPLSNGAEIKNPKKTVPLGLLTGIALIVILYVSIQLISQGVLGENLNAANKTPLADVAGIVFGKTGIIVMIVVTAISMFGALSCDMLSMPRVVYAGAKKGLLPKKLAEIHPKFITPHYAVYVYATAGFIISVSGSFKQLAVISSASLLLLYLAVVLATIKLRTTTNQSSEKTFKVPGGYVVPILAAAGIIWFLSNLELKEMISFAVFIIVLTAIYFIKNKFKKL